MNSTNQQASTGRGHPRLVIIVLVLIFSAPLLSAWFILNYGGLVNFGGASHGDLYEPMVNLPNVPLEDPFAADEKSENLHGKWSLLYMQAGDCDQTCKENIYEMRQIRLALSRYARNLQRIWMTDIQDNGRIRELLTEYEGTLILPLSKAAGQLSPADFAAPPVSKPLESDALYVIDPEGRLVLRYRSGADPEGIISDLERLLKGSRISPDA